MSRQRDSRAASPGGFPRVSGDEPLETATDETIIEFSPRERG